MDRHVLQDFREQVRDFCERELPESIRAKVLNNHPIEKEDYVVWQRLLRKPGWFGGHWPTGHGGLGWSKLQQWVFEEELYRAGAPWIIPFGITYVGPVIYTFGNDAQKAKYLQAILNSEVWWCQGYSEPNAGSDLASLSTRARRVGDEYILNGQKTWTTMAQWADMAFVLARTSSKGKPQDGISFFVVDMNSLGISVRPIKSIDRCAHLNEVFFDDVRVPASQLIGEENRGWTYAKFLLDNERLLAADVAKSQRMLKHLYQLADMTGSNGSLSTDPVWRCKVAELEAELLALEALCLGFLEAEQRGQKIGAEVSLLKIVGSELSQRISALAINICGLQGLSYQIDTFARGEVEHGLKGAAGIVREYLHGRATTIYGGSNEIQRNIIAKAGLGL